MIRTLCQKSIIDMINSYRSGKFIASNQSQIKVQLLTRVALKEKLLPKTGTANASCSSSELSSKNFSKEKKHDKSLAGMIPGHAGCSKSCCSQEEINNKSCLRSISRYNNFCYFTIISVCLILLLEVL